MLLVGPARPTMRGRRVGLSNYGLTRTSFLTSVTPGADAAARSALSLSANECTWPWRCTVPLVVVTQIDRASRCAIRSSAALTWPATSEAYGAAGLIVIRLFRP